jgi:hypothetical protein
MVTIQTIIEQIENLNATFREGKISRTDYLKQHAKLVVKFKKAHRGDTLADILRKAGVKITKLGRGYYLYAGINFTVELMEDSCESTWWEVCIWDDKVDTRVFEYFNEYNMFDRKQDVVGALFQFDKSLSQ